MLTTSSPPVTRMFEPPYAYGTVQQTASPAVDGMVPVVMHIPTDKPYVFITIDDGAVRHPKARELMINAGVWPSAFLNTKYAEDPTTFVEDFTAFLNRAKQDGLTPVPLEDFLG